MNPEQLRQVEAEFARVAPLPAVERGPALDAIGDAGVRAEVESLLASEPAGSWFLREPAELPQPEFIGTAMLRAGDRIGRFVVQRCLAQGGMGAVYEAEQDDPRRRVAIKVMRHGIVLGTGFGPELWRFRAESRTLARLDHPSIAKVHEAGLHPVCGGGFLPYFAMELIAGATDVLGHAERERLDLEARVLLMTRVVDAVHYGHTRGVVHRDLKPANILVDGTGRPIVIDFGIARVSAADVTHSRHATRTGELLGSPRYMSPEQCLGNAEALDSRTDVYSLGVVLYELLTGRLPYELDQDSWLQMSLAIRETPPLPPGRVDPRLAGDLERVLLKALAKEAAQRYDSAAQLAEDLRRYLDDEPVFARPPSVRYRAAKWMRRHRVGAALGVVTAAALVVGTVGSTWGMLKARASAALLRDEVAVKERLRREASEAAERAELINGFLERMLRSPDPEHAGRDVLMSEAVRRAVGDIDTYFAKQPGVGAVVRMTAADTFAGLGEMKLAREEGERALAACMATHGRDSERTIDALFALARYALSERDFAAARDRLVDAHEIAGRMYGQAAPRTLALACNLATVRSYLGEFADARAAIERLIPLVPNDDPATLVALRTNLASIAQNQRDFATAERENRALLEDVRRWLGPAHRRSLLVAYNLAAALVAEGKHDEASALLEETARGQAALLGPVHPETVATLSLRGEALAEQGRHGEAERAFEELLASLRAGGLERSTDALGARVRLLRLRLLRMRPPDCDFAAAEEESRAIVALAREVGPGSRVLSEALRQLAVLLEEQQRYGESEPLRRENAECTEGFLGKDNPRAVIARLAWYESLCRAGRRAEADAPARRLIDEALARFGPEHDLRADLVRSCRSLQSALDAGTPDR